MKKYIVYLLLIMVSILLIGCSIVNEQDNNDEESILDKWNAIPIDQRFNRNNPDIRYSLPEDAPYMAAVERGNTDEAANMIDQYAESKGYTDEAYHGTQSFGFTEFDMDASHSFPHGAGR